VTAAYIAFSAALGSVVGSFLNVVVWRVPRNESVVRPRSHCPNCDAPIRPRDEVPVLSWAALRGRCRDCSAAISARYPAVEFVTAVLFAAVVIRFAGADPVEESWRVVPAFFFLVSVGVALALIDIDTHRLPDKLTLPGYVAAPALLGLATLLGAGTAPLVRAILGMIAMFALYFALWFAAPGGMGFGDVKLAGVLGAFLGWLGWDIWGVGLLAGWLLGGVVGTALLIFRRAGRKTKVPFGPFMIAGALLAVLVGAPISRAWLGS
jgi:leader peptidase (prepilin peptidase) / N-methyltransferase